MEYWGASPFTLSIWFQPPPFRYDCALWPICFLCVYLCFTIVFVYIMSLLACAPTMLMFMFINIKMCIYHADASLSLVVLYTTSNNHTDIVWKSRCLYFISLHKFCLSRFLTVLIDQFSGWQQPQPIQYMNSCCIIINRFFPQHFSLLEWNLSLCSGFEICRAPIVPCSKFN